MVENFNNSTKSGVVGFCFDIVLAHLNLEDVKDQENSKLRVDAKLIDNNLKITSSRINVNVFKSGNSVKFTEKPLDLKNKLLQNPLECQVYYEDKLIGSCNVKWPNSFTGLISETSDRELTCCNGEDIKQDNKIVGRMEIIARIQIKSYESETDQVSLCNPTDALVPNDVMFVVRENIGCENDDVRIIPATESGSSVQATCLDLSDFRHVHGKTVPNTNVLDCIDAQCCKTKRLANNKQMMKQFLGKSSESANCSKNKPRQQHCQMTCEQQMKCMDLTSKNKFSSCSSTDSYKHCHCISDESFDEEKSMVCQNDEEPTNRYCPFCNDNITWLPKYAACPKCGFRPISYDIEEEPYDDTLTADEILQEFIESKAHGDIITHPNNISMKRSQQTGSCRCNCKNDKLCAYCRIKQLCEDIFQPTHKRDDDCGKCETKSSADLYKICKSSSPDCRPYLIKVFQMLKDLYDINETETNNILVACERDSKKISKNLENVNDLQKVSQRMEEVQHLARSQTKGKNIDAERKTFLKKNFQKHKSCKSKIVNYNSQRKYTVAKIGHKTCFSGPTMVPRNMGWLWNSEAKGLRTGWMPGAIRKPIKVLMQYFLNKSNKLQVHDNSDKINNEETDCIKEPTLHICKKNGAYYITLRPHKNIGTRGECRERLNMKPIQFQITKNPLLLKRRQLKQYLKDMGFSKCICHQPIHKCCCRSFLEKKKLEYQCCKECHKRELPNCIDSLVLSDTSDSEPEFEFGVTPPAEVVAADTCLKNSQRVSSATQYEEGDWILKQEIQKPLGKLYNCAIGNRFGTQFGPYGKKGYSPGAVPIEGIYGPHGIIIAERKLSKQHKGAKSGGRFSGPDGKFSMLRYMAHKAATKPSPEEIAERKRQQWALLKGANPPLLCNVDRLGKPIDICAACNPAILGDNRIC